MDISVQRELCRKFQKRGKIRERPCLSKGTIISGFSRENSVGDIFGGHDDRLLCKVPVVLALSRQVEVAPRLGEP